MVGCTTARRSGGMFGTPRHPPGLRSAPSQGALQGTCTSRGGAGGRAGFQPKPRCRVRKWGGGGGAAKTRACDGAGWLRGRESIFSNPHTK